MEAEPDTSEAIFLDRNIRHLRRNMGWSQEELGARIGLNRGNIASYENGTAEPKIYNLLKLADLFGVSMVDIAYKDLSQESVSDTIAEGAPRTPDMDRLVRYKLQAQELQAVMRGLHTCCQFKIKHAGEVCPKDLHVVSMHFEELFNAAQTLLKGHLELLDHLENVKKM